MKVISQRRPVAAALAILSSLALVIAGCGGGDDDQGSTEAGATAPGATTTALSPELAAKVERLIPIASRSQAVGSVRESMRIANAQGELLVIAQEHPEAIAPLTAFLRKRDYDEIVALYNFYVQLGQPGSEKVLIAALQHEGFSEQSSPMAFAFLASGNKKLVQGTKQWAEDNGLTISGNPGGIAGPKWGQVGIGTPVVPTAPPPAP